MTPLLRLLPVFIIAVLIAFELRIPAMAQAQMRQVELNRDMVERFLVSYPEVRAVGARFAKEPGRKDAGDPMAVFSEVLQHKAALGAVRDVLARYGFKTFGNWLEVARSVAIAYGFAKSGKSPGELGDQAGKALEEIRGNPQLDDAQKQQMEALVKRQMEMLRHFEPSENNLALAREFQPRIAAVLDSE